MKTHCTCCYPACPVPQVECQDKDFNLTTLQGFTAFTRYSTDPDGTLGDQLDPQFPASCQKYKVSTLSKGWSTPASYVQKSYAGTPDEYVTFEMEESGTATLTQTIEHVGCHSPNPTVLLGAGSITFESTDTGRYYDSEDEVYKYWTKEKITTEWTYVGGTTIDNPDAGQPGEPATIDVPHGRWLETTTTRTKTTHDATEVVTTDKEVVLYNSVGETFVRPSGAYTRVKTQSHTAKTDTVTYSESTSSISTSGVWYDNETLSTPWTEAAIITDLKACINAHEWESGACSADLAVTYNQKPKLDPQGEPVTEDHDNDPNTPEVPVYEDETDCVKTVLLRKYRYRFAIPPDFNPPPPPAPQKWHGTWHKIQWQEIFTPADHDPQNPTASPKVITDKEIEWNGPGDELETFSGWNSLTDEQKEARRDSWKTAWTVVDFPTQKGQTTIKLKRSQCYHGAPWVRHSS